MAPELSSELGKPEASLWAIGWEPVPVNLMGWILFFFALLNTVKRSGKSLCRVNSGVAGKSRGISERPLCFSSLYIALLREKLSEFPPSPRDLKAQQCPYRCQNNFLLQISMRSRTAASLFLKTKGQLVFQMFAIATEWFLSFLPPASIPTLSFAILSSNLQAQITWAQPFAFHLCLIPTLSLIRYTTPFKGDIPWTEAGDG